MFPSPIMHIPDGFLSVTVSVVLWVLSVAVVVAALARVNRELGEREVPVMGVLAAAIFAGQMLNFAVAGGTSGHLMGAALASILLGPWAAVVVMTSVVSVQALIFQDGGLLALGANLFNMAVIGPFAGYFIYRAVTALAGRLGAKGPTGIYAGGFASAWTSVFVAALAVGLELSLSGTSPASIALPAMGAVHAVIGLGEGLITLGALSLVYAARRDLLKIGQPQPGGSRVAVAGGLAITALLAVLSPLASTHPDGLEWVAQQAGFLDKAAAPAGGAMSNYTLPGISSPGAATVAAGLLGAVIVLGVALLAGYARRSRAAHSTDSSGD